MIHLRARAHQSLDDFRKGKGSPIGRHHMQEPQSPNDDDELAMLGGKTRLVKKEEPSSPLLLDRSPHTQNPVVPLPLAGVDMDRNMLEYLSSFSHPGQQQQQQPVSAGSHGSFSDLEMSPVSLYGMSSISPTSAYPPDTSFMNHPPMMQNHHQQSPSSAGHRSSHSMSNGNGMNGGSHSNGMNGTMPSNGIAPQVNSFPQYFPVYDYGNGMSSSMAMDTGYGSAPMLESNPRPGGQRRSGSGSPEANTIHSTWQDFVALQMNQN